jgi:hypothetical protein
MALAQVNEHGRLIAAAAKAALTPLGCRRKRQSRLWYCDQRFRIISIEFQPSTWSKGLPQCRRKMAPVRFRRTSS